MARKKQAIHASGLVEVKITVGKTFNGKRIQKSFYGTSKIVARRKADEYLQSLAFEKITGEVFIQKGSTFGTWATKWLETYKKGKVKDHTYEYTYRLNLTKHIIPYFENHDLRDIKQVDIQTYFNNCNLARSTQKKHLTILSNVFDKAMDNGLCHKTPVKNIALKEEAPKERTTLNAEQMGIMIKHVKNKHDAISMSIITMLQTGMRRSEFLGLQWDDIDLTNKTISIKRAVVQSQKKIIIGEPKTKTSIRTIPVTPLLFDYLTQIKKDGIYATNTNQPYKPSTFSLHFVKYMEEMSSLLELPVLSPHELRHTFGTVLRENGTDIYTISKLLGHADISITSKIYVHNDIEVLRNNMKM